jgi:hypothetical protein
VIIFHLAVDLKKTFTLPSSSMRREAARRILRSADTMILAAL